MARSRAALATKRRAARARKISITVDERVLRSVETRARRSRMSLSAQVTAALARDLRRTRLRELIEEYERRQGQISEAELASIRAECQD
jgi:hypothetical protein